MIVLKLLVNQFKIDHSQNNRTRYIMLTPVNWFKGINFREFGEFLPKSRNLVFAKIMKISKFAKIKFFSRKNRGFLNFLFIQESHKLE